ncbi:MAG: hypothetical protein JWM11_3845 [Planctomycetaceae bacterium]|nr:hypothetical protein [Planctomycetaceae bacterium]
MIGSYVAILEFFGEPVAQAHAFDLPQSQALRHLAHQTSRSP